MHITVGEYSIPYPFSTLEGKLVLCGLSPKHVQSLVFEIQSLFSGIEVSLDELYQHIESNLERRFKQDFRSIVKYERLCRTRSVHPLIVVLEGASSTGKSMLSISLVKSITATRMLSTDTVRQLLRALMSKSEVPELYCHTYQAYNYKQVGSDNLSPVVRGYIAQVQLMERLLRESISRCIKEGANAIVEGVHIIPGSLKRISNAVTEILVHPDKETHHAMFMAKTKVSGLQTISNDPTQREREFEAAREIQEYMSKRAMKSGVYVLHFRSYESAIKEIHGLILQRIRSVAASC